VYLDDPLADGVQTNDLEAAATAETVLGPVDNGTVRFDVTPSIAAWQADPDSNHGWALLGNGTDRWSFASSEDAIAPKLIVTYSLPDEMQQATSPYDAQYSVFSEPTLLDSMLGPTDAVEIRRAGGDVALSGLSGDNALLRIEFAGPQPAGIYDYAVFEKSNDFETFHDLAGNATGVHDDPVLRDGFRRTVGPDFR